jgi:hypothetical protein
MNRGVQRPGTSIADNEIQIRLAYVEKQLFLTIAEAQKKACGRIASLTS